jgi:ABC-2 type transport system ATP-binding protein
VVAANGEAAAAEVRRALAQRGHAVARVERIVPSLEDVFVSLIEAHDRAEPPQQEVRR